MLRGDDADPRFADAQETDVGRPMIAKNTFTIDNPWVLRPWLHGNCPKITVPANSTGYIQNITSDGFVMCDFDEFPVIRLSAEEAVHVAGLERRSRRHILIHADKDNRPQHRVWRLSKNIALKNAPGVKSLITEPARIAHDAYQGEMSFKQAAKAAVTRSLIPLATDVATVATLYGAGMADTWLQTTGVLACGAADQAFCRLCAAYSRRGSGDNNGIANAQAATSQQPPPAAPKRGRDDANGDTDGMDRSKKRRQG